MAHRNFIQNEHKVVDLDRWNAKQIKALRKDALIRVAEEMAAIYALDRKELALDYYIPASEDVEKVHLSNARVRFCGGGNGCLPLDGPVLMSDGTWRPLGEIKPGDFVMAADPETGRAVPAPVTRTWRSGVKLVHRVTFSDGGSFEATADHKVPLFLGSGRKTTKGNPKRAHKRKLGDYLEPITRRAAVNPAKRIAAISPSDIQFDEGKLPIDPWLLGAWLGDGSRAPKFHNTDSGVLDRFRGLVEQLGLRLVHYHAADYGISGPGGGRLNVFTALLRSLGLDQCNSYTKFIPEAGFRLNREGRMQLLAGLIDTDGGLNQYSSCSRELATGFVRLMRSVGGKATLTERDATCQTGAVVHYYGVYWRLDEPLPLCLTRKQQPLGKRPIDLRRRVCRSVEPVGWRECGDIEVDHPAHCYITGDYVIVSNSSKTESALVECVMMATGVIPSHFKEKFPDHDWKKKLRGPVSGRIVCQSITNTLQPIILPKLRWNCWTGTDEPGGARGHWGWIPRMCLIDGEWQKSWSEKNRLLRLLYRNPDNIDQVVGESRIQFQSYDVDAADQESGDLHFVLLDEPPSEAIYNANEARTMRVGGWIMLSMTWPDDPAIAVDWIFDRIYDRGIEGPNKWADYECFRLRTMKNQFIDQANVAKQREAWDQQKRNSRLEGMPIRVSNRVHELFTDAPEEWCFTCGERQPVDVGHCTQCGSTDTATYSHVAEFDVGRGWPVIWVLDPHPRKPHMSAYIAVTPGDDWWMVAELECKGDPTDMRVECDELEAALSLNVVRRLIDPRMAAHPSGTNRERSWQDEFDSAGLFCEPADNSDTGRSIVDQYLRPDPHTKRPRILHHRRCVNATQQMKRFMWDDWRQGTDKAQKQKVKEKYDDYPACWRYLANAQPSYEGMARPVRMIQAGGVIRQERRLAAWR